MQTLILELINVSITASWVVLAVLVLRLALHKSPKWIHCLLWAVVALRLLIPVHIESQVSLIPESEPVRATMVQVMPSEVESLPQEGNIISQEPERKEEPKPDVWAWASLIWACGTVSLLAYGLISTWLLRRKLGPSLRLQDRVYRCDYIDSPFILGIFAPRIYLPSDLEESQIGYILAHEQAHLKRKDHWWKPLAFCLLAVHWFNPFLWVAYILLCRDIEKACDEKAIQNMDDADKVGYSRTLLECSVQRKMVLACPVAFGEVSVKSRIKSVLNYKKPAFWLVATAAVVCVAAFVCFLTNPIPCSHTYEIQTLSVSTCTSQGIQSYTCTKCGESYNQYLPRLAHVYQSEQLQHAPTCTAQGSETCACTLCGADAYRILPMAEHAYKPEQVLEAANCTYAGLQTVACPDCGAKEVVPIGTNNEHTYTFEVEQAPTCTKPGHGIKTCTRCNTTETYEIPVIDHNYKDGYWIGANCRQPGYQQKICRDCGYSCYKKTDEKMEHKWFGMDDDARCHICGISKETYNAQLAGIQEEKPSVSTNSYPLSDTKIPWDDIIYRPTMSGN